jgi:hypothetical protein
MTTQASASRNVNGSSMTGLQPILGALELA